MGTGGSHKKGSISINLSAPKNPNQHSYNIIVSLFLYYYDYIGDLLYPSTAGRGIPNRRVRMEQKPNPQRNLFSCVCIKLSTKTTTKMQNKPYFNGSCDAAGSEAGLRLLFISFFAFRLSRALCSSMSSFRFYFILFIFFALI